MVRCTTLLLAIALPTLHTTVAGAAEEAALSRSIYIPVIFSVPPELAPEVRIWIGDEDRPRPPRRHIFQFTFYPDKGDRFFPDQVEVKIQAEGVCGGSGIDTNFIITPLGIITAEKTLEFDQEAMEKQVRSRRPDIRVAPKVVNIRCGSRDAVDADIAPPPEKVDTK